ncbi:MAG: PIG-L family deacetylase [Bryobacterales bacterium]|nr:PIG-L family deacetylase [Bryobacterales bacterium]
MNEAVLIVVAHPDDETLGCAHELLRRPGECRILHTTDGAPFEARFWEQAGAASREAYAQSRHAELRSAMEIFGIGERQIATLPIADREAARQLPALTAAIRETLLRDFPSVVYTHPFEGGHPDHDATALAVQRALAGLRAEGLAVPAHREFTGYHARDGEFFSGAFLHVEGVVTEVPLSEEEQACKRAALNEFHSQQRVIQRFALSPQRWRAAPRYDFTQRPHAGPLYYEIREMGYSFEGFAALVRAWLDNAR